MVIHLSKKSILVVDDDNDIADLVKIALQKYDCNVSKFNDPFMAMSYIKEHPFEFDAILTDIRMPGMNGIELITKVNEINPKVKAFLMTAFEIDTIKPQIDSLDMEIVEIFQKPISIVNLSHKITSILK